MTLTWDTLSPTELTTRLAHRLAAAPGLIRVAVDGPAALDPAALVESLRDPLLAVGRPVVHIAASSFWRDASLRLEYGHQDWASFETWLDADALRREVLDPAARHGSYLPSLRDPVTNRSTRATPQPLAAGTVLLVSGEFLLGRGLPFDRTVHLATSSAVRARLIPGELAWALPAYDDYERRVAPAEQADIALKLDRRHPVARGLT